MRKSCEVTVVIPAFDEEENISILIDGIRKILGGKNISHEIWVIDAGSEDDTVKKAKDAGAKVAIQTSPGYGMALKEGFQFATGEYIVTMDADLSHSPEFLNEMMDQRSDADMIIASRYTQGGSAEMSSFRYLLSIILNRSFSLILNLPFRDISSGYRLYSRRVLDNIDIESRDFDVLEEILVKTYRQGFSIIEIPFRYKPRIHGKSHAKLIRFGISYGKTFYRMWKLRKNY